MFYYIYLQSPSPPVCDAELDSPHSTIRLTRSHSQQVHDAELDSPHSTIRLTRSHSQQVSTVQCLTVILTVQSFIVSVIHNDNT